MHVSSITALAKQRLLCRCEEVCRRGLFDGPKPAAPLTGLGGYHATSIGDAIPLETDKIALPKDGIAGSVPITQLLPAQDRTIYSDTESDLVVQVSNQERESVGKLVLVKKGNYSGLIEVLEKKGLVELTREQPKEINGIFGVPKPDGKQRLIIDARRANLHFADPDDPDLPHPGLFAQLVASRETKLWSAKIDVDNFYHRLSLPSHFRTYFGLPPVVRNGIKLFPVVRSLPMGWSHSVVIAQKIHRHLLSESSLQSDKEIRHGNTNLIEDYRFGGYIDDFFIFGYDPAKVKQGYHEVYSLFEAKNLPPKPSKVEPPSLLTKPILGIDVTQEAVFEPNMSKLKELIATTRSLCNNKYVSLKKLETVLGQWNWFALLQRSAFALLYEAYLCLTEAKEKQRTLIRITERLRSEFLGLVSISPLLYSDCKKPWGKFMLATDASELGAGGVYTRFSAWHPNLHSLYRNFFCTLTNPNGEPYCPPSADWKIAIRNPWKFQGHINLLEGEALFLGLRWLARQSHSQGKRVAVHLDSQVIAFLLAKGRSSRRSLLSLARRTSALVLASDIKVVPIWIPSASNPADGPSRATGIGSRQPQTKLSE